MENSLARSGPSGWERPAPCSSCAGRARLPAVVRSHAGRGAAGCCSSPRPGWSLAPGFAMTHRPLESLLEKLCSGDPEAAERVFLAFEPYLRMVVRKKLPGRLRAKFDSIDVVQSVWADVLRGFREAGWRFADEAHLRAFLVKLTRHRFIDHLRRHRTAVALERPLGELVPENEPQSRLPSRERGRAGERTARADAGTLPPAHREIVGLRMRGMPVAEIAARTGLHVGSVHRIFHDLACRVAVGARIPRTNRQGRVRPPGRAIPTCEDAAVKVHERSPSLTDGPGGEWPPVSAGSLVARSRESGPVTRLIEEFAAAWAGGERPPAETFLERHPSLTVRPDAAIRLIYEEVCLRQSEGQDVPLSELVRRFPQWQTELEVVLDCDRLLAAAPGPPVFPEPEEALGDFLLLAELGRGARGRCFLAAQPSLSYRQVVLKVTTDDHGEHLSLARLQHTHIMPLYSEHEFPARRLRALCMPYLGGTTLARILAALNRVPADRRSGQSLLDVLAPPGTRSRGRSLPRPRRSSSSRSLHTSRRSAGSSPAWPMPCNMLTSGGSCTWT